MSLVFMMQLKVAVTAPLMWMGDKGLGMSFKKMIKKTMSLCKLVSVTSMKHLMMWSEAVS